MSSSGLIAAKKRIEASIKKHEIPTNETPIQVDSCQNGVLYLSLIQSRLNWTNYIFPKYKSDPVQQPKRTNATRKKWPNMKYLGTCTLELGTHIFEQTCFFQATRIEQWISVAKEQGLQVEQDQQDQLVYNDIVFELKEMSNERFILPKEMIVQVDQENWTILASFTLPIDHSIADHFFDTPKEKIVKYGRTCQLKAVKEFHDANSQEPELLDIYTPVNIRITNASESLVEALEQTADPIDRVQNILKQKTKYFPKKKYIKFDLSNDIERQNEIQELVQKATTIPDIITGPIQAEKKRNEILNAIKLGKRQRDEKFEAELPKNKYVNAKEDSLFKCSYCSTKHTHMWRPGPNGQGTLCNSCGIQWKRGEILVDAPVISKEEEIKLINERKEREKAAEALESEKIEREPKKQSKKSERPSTTNEIAFANQLLQKRNQQQIPTEEENKNKKKTDTTDKKAQSTAKPKKTVQTKQPDQSTKQEQTKPIPLSLYSAAGIPLPTLFINFAGHLQFAHPNCGITLLDRFFSIRICKDGSEQTTIEFSKKELMNSQFEIAKEGEATLQRDILRMKVAPIEPKTIAAFGQTFVIDQQHSIQIRFLEKLDPTGGAVVQRILQRWLITVPQQT